MNTPALEIYLIGAVLTAALYLAARYRWLPREKEARDRPGPLDLLLCFFMNVFVGLFVTVAWPVALFIAAWGIYTDARETFAPAEDEAAPDEA